MAAWILVGSLGLLNPSPALPQETIRSSNDLFVRENLIAWCIVPFDSRKRGPEERAEMLVRLGLKKFAYDWREEHIPTFDDEMEMLERYGIELSAFWFPFSMNKDAHTILNLLERHGIKTQLWVTTSGGEIECSAEEQRQRVEDHARALRPIVDAAAKIGCSVGLYNHGSWFGEPENQIEIIEYMKASNVGIVYNQHHGHEHIDRFPELMKTMKPYLYAVNLNGTDRHGDKEGRKILALAQGSLDLSLITTIRDSGYTGPIGILGHTQDDAETTLNDNLVGLEWLLPQLGGIAPTTPKPIPQRGKKKITENELPLESSYRRAALPQFQSIPAAKVDTLTPANGYPKGEAYISWQRSHGDAGNSRFSTLSQINRDTIHSLEVAWEYRAGDGAGNIQCNPIIVGDTLYAPIPSEHLVALDATTGEERWRFKARGQPALRGLVYWPGTETDAARIFFNAGESLWALDPATGTPIESFGDQGVVNSGRVAVAGAVYQDILILPGLAKDVYGYDVVTGERRWIFHTIPKPGEFGHDTWVGQEDGANCWGGMALDEERGLAFVSTGSPKPNFSGVGHHGSNLFANCVIALDALTGERRWHVQEIRHDIWDLDIPAPPNLVTVMHEGKKVDAVAQVTKIGNTLLLDRLTGKPLFPFRLRRAPVSKLPGEQTWSYQPDIELPEPFAKQAFSKSDITNLNDDAAYAIAMRVEGANYGWFEPFEEGKPTILYGIHGGAEWTGAAFDPRRGKLYVSANEIPWAISVFRADTIVRDPASPPTRGQNIYEAACMTCHGDRLQGNGMAPPLLGLARRMDDSAVRTLLDEGQGSMPASEAYSPEDLAALLDYIFLREAGIDVISDPSNYSFNGYHKLLDPEGYPGSKPPWGTLNCIDLNTGKIDWKVPLGYYPELAEKGITDTGAENFGGATVTAGGLVFCAGTPDNLIRAFDSDTGEELWKHKLPFGGYAPRRPMPSMENSTSSSLLPAEGNLTHRRATPGSPSHYRQTRARPTRKLIGLRFGVMPLARRSDGIGGRIRFD